MNKDLHTDTEFVKNATELSANAAFNIFDANRQQTAKLHKENGNKIQLNSSNMVSATLPSRKKVLLLCDSGATKSLISISSIENSPYLSSLEKLPTPVTKFQVANGSYVTSRFAIRVQLNIQGTKLELTCLAVPNLGTVDIILGSKSLKELNGVMDFSNNTLKLKQKSFLMKATENMKIQPGQHKIITLMGCLPKFIRNNEVLIVPSNKLKKYTACNIFTRLEKGKAKIIVFNDSKKPVHVKANKPIAKIDLSNLTAIPTPVRQVVREDKETVLYVEAVDNDNSQLGKVNRHCNIDRLTAHNQQDIYTLNRELYPHLDPTDHRLNKTREELITEQVKLSESNNLTESQKTELLNVIKRNHEAFSLYDEIGDAKGTEIEFDLVEGAKPFYIRPYTLNNDEKAAVDKEIDKLIKMKVLERKHTDYSSPMMVLNKKGTNEKI